VWVEGKQPTRDKDTAQVGMDDQERLELVILLFAELPQT